MQDVILHYAHPYIYEQRMHLPVLESIPMRQFVQLLRDMQDAHLDGHLSHILLEMK
jgi:hypothetical protein